jgi:hypothetical protein
MERSRRSSRWIALLAAAAALAVPVSAHGGTPFSVGTGFGPDVLVDPASGLAHVVFADGDANVLRYCQVPRGATACTLAQELGPPYAGEDGTVQRGFLLFGAGTTLYAVVANLPPARSYLYTSTDSGQTWSPRAQIYDYAADARFEPILGPQPGQITFAGSFGAHEGVWAAAVDGSEAAVDARTGMPEPTNDVDTLDFAAALLPDNSLLAVRTTLAEKLQFWRQTPGSDPSVSSSWTGPTDIGDGDDQRLGDGPGGPYLLSVAGPSTSRHMEVRRWNGNGFNPPVVVARELGAINDIAVSPSGGVGAIWRLNQEPGGLRFALSTDGGARWQVSTIAQDGNHLYDQQDVSLASDNRGFAVWEGNTQGTSKRVDIRMASTDPLGTGTGGGGGTGPQSGPVARPTTTKSAAVAGGTVTFHYPRECIAPGQRARVRLRFKRRLRSGNVVTRVRRARFSVGTRRTTDRRPPFAKTLVIPNPRAGQSYVLRARAQLAKRRGRAKKTIVTVLRVCG